MPKELAHIVTPKFSVWLKQPKERNWKEKKICKQTEPANSRSLYEVNSQKKCFVKKCFTESVILKVSNEIDNLKAKWGSLLLRGTWGSGENNCINSLHCKPKKGIGKDFTDGLLGSSAFYEKKSMVSLLSLWQSAAK